jgi:signal transduction histidine kinase
LKGAAAMPKPEQFDLSELVSDTVREELERRLFVEVSLIGPKPMIVTSDPALVRLAFANGLRNAAEATEQATQQRDRPIVITWGLTDVDCWISILDSGSGIVGPVESAFELGKTTKRGHSGFGLAIARQAAETMGGTVLLQPAKNGGAIFILRWER